MLADMWEALTAYWSLELLGRHTFESSSHPGAATVVGEKQTSFQIVNCGAPVLA